jgi:SNF2 family DNA or RNA helicase
MNLMSHQLRFVQIAQKHSNYFLGWEPGCGKTIAILAAIDDHRSRGWSGVTLVLAPKSILRSAWLADASHFPNLKCGVVWSASKGERLKQIRSNSDVLITNYETFKRHLADFIAAGVKRLVVDESSKIKCHTTQITKSCIEFSDQMDSVYLMSGTPAPNNATEWFSQMRCVNRELFGSNYWRFCYTYFSPLRRMIQGKERIIGWKPIAPMADEFAEKLRSQSWSLRRDECLDLPEQTDVVREVELGNDERVAYTTMLQELRVEMANGESLTAAMQAKAMKLRQITGGAIISEGTARPLGTSKIDVMGEVLDEIGGQPVVVWAEFTNEIDRISNAIRARGESVAVIDGRSRDRSDTIESFQGGKIQRLVCHPAAAGHGVTLTAAAYDIFYSHSFSSETYEQARARIYRAGQHRPVTHFHLIAVGTVDQRVWKALQNKRSGSEAVMEMLTQPESDGELAISNHG